jgi:hypothetical protein
MLLAAVPALIAIALFVGTLNLRPGTLRKT